MGNKPSSVAIGDDGLPPPLTLENDKKKKKKDKKKKSCKHDDIDGVKNGGMATPSSVPVTSTIFRSPPEKANGSGGKAQLSKVILPDQDLDIKVYKKSRDNLNENLDRSRRYRSLPRSKSAGFRKSTDTLLSCESRQQHQRTFHHQGQRYSSFAAAPGNTSFNSRWSSIVGNESPTFREKPPGLKGIMFPDEETILTNTSLFEKSYVEHFVDHYYSSLPEVVQLSAIIIAYKRTYEKNSINYQPINLRQYFLAEGEQDIPSDLISAEAKKWFIPALPDAMLMGLVHLRGADKTDESRLRTCIDLVRCVTLGAAKELSRIYEYQISIVSDLASIQILGRHAAERSVEYLRSGNRFVERDSIIEGTAYFPVSNGSQRSSLSSGRSQSPGLGYISAIFGEEREQQWEVSHVFACCGLRLDGGHSKHSRSWPVFLTSRDALPLIYGFRSPICKRDFETGTENISQTELALFSEVLQDNPDDFHRDYIPLRLAGSNHNSSLESRSISSLAMDIRRHEGEGRGSRCGQQSTLIGHDNRHNGFSKSSVRTSTLASNSRYGSLAKSAEFGYVEREPSHSRSFQREMPRYQSERPSAVGGRLPKYSYNRPERIAAGNGDISLNSSQLDGSTLKKNTIGRSPANQNHISYNAHTLNKSPSYMTNGNGHFDYGLRGPATGPNQHNMSPNHRQTMPTGLLTDTVHSANGRNGSFSRLPPKPPLRTISSSQYNHHLNVSPCQPPHQHISANPITAPVLTTHPRLPPAIETSFDCDVGGVAGVGGPSKLNTGVNVTVPGQPSSSSMDFLDFKSFLKLVEQQNACLKSLDPVASALSSQQKLVNGVNHLETDFPEVDEQSTINTTVTSNV